MSDPTSAAAPAAPIAEAPSAAAPTAQPTAPVVAAKPPVRHPYGVRKAAPVKAADVSVAASPTAPPAPTEAPAAPKATPQKPSRVVALREREIAALKGEVTPLREKQERYEKALAPLAARELESLPESTRAVLQKKHGKDALGMIDEINYLRSLGLLSEASAKPATTAAPPPSVSQTTEQDQDLVALRTHQRLEKQSPTLAIAYYSQHRDAIARGQKKASAH